MLILTMIKAMTNTLMIKPKNKKSNISTNFFQVCCDYALKMEVWTKIYRAVVDAIHQTMKQMLVMLKHMLVMLKQMLVMLKQMRRSRMLITMSGDSN